MKKTAFLIIITVLLFLVSFGLGRAMTKQTPTFQPATIKTDEIDLISIPEATLSAEEVMKSAGIIAKDVVITTNPKNKTKINTVPKQLEIHFSAPIRFNGIGVTGSSGGVRLPEPPKVSVAGLFVIIPFPQDATNGTYTVNYKFCSISKDGTERSDDCREEIFSFDLLR